MNTAIKSVAFALGGSTLFVGSMVGFARMQGAEWHELPLLGRAFPSPPAQETSPVAPIQSPEPTTPTPPKLEARTAQLGVLDVFRIESPWTAAEIDQFVSEMKARKLELEQRLQALDAREQKLDHRSKLLDEQYAVLKDLRAELERWKAELEQRAAEIENAKQAKDSRDEAGWAQLAKLFEKGDPAELSTRLRSYSPPEAAKILARLKPARAQELLNGLSGAEWKEYADAYRQGAK
jgi:flagellar motility protein MotE (MotC chaperone)